MPIFWVHGLTDPLFPAFEPLTVRNAIRAADPTYPIKVWLGDIGHDYTGDRKDEWDLVKAQMNDFLDHFLRPDRTPDRPAFDVGATVTRCLDHDAPLRYESAPDWHDLHRTTSATPAPPAAPPPPPHPRATASPPATR